MTEPPLAPRVETCSSCLHEHMCDRFDIDFEGAHMFLCASCAKGEPCLPKSTSVTTSS